ncbi:MAG: BA14K family protein [Pseudolabrys sp.]
MAGATAQAAPIGPMPAASIAAVAEADGPAVTPVQYYGRRYYGHRRYDRRRRHRDDAGAAAAGAIFGMALGAIIASQPHRQSAVEYCSRRFRSYDPYSGTYLGYDGRRHPCP